MRHFLATILAAMLAFLPATQSVANDFSLDDAIALIRAGQSDEAYARLVREETQRAGDIEFDYWLGVAALDSQRFVEATLAFERVSVQQPGNLGALVDIGLAYVALGDVERAREAFETAERNDPPRLVRQLIRAPLEGRMAVIAGFPAAGAKRCILAP